MTRGMFFKMLAALAQDINIPRCSDARIGKDTACWVDQECKEGEERCPLGHCQKPMVVWLGEYTQRVTTSQQPEWPIAFEQRVCSTCGVVYVQPRKGRGQ
jgi:hypothetical protein